MTVDTHDVRPSDSLNEVRRQRLVELNDRFGITSQSQLAQILDVTPGMVSQWRTGRRPIPSEALATTFGVSLDWLAGFSSEMWSPSIIALRRTIHAYLRSLPASETRTLRSPDTAPEDRLRFVAQYATSLLPSLVTSRYLSLIVRLNIDTIDDILASRTYIDESPLRRFADWIDIPIDWFLFGDDSLIDDPRTDDYKATIRAAIAKGVSPDRLTKLIELL